MSDRHTRTAIVALSRGVLANPVMQVDVANYINELERDNAALQEFKAWILRKIKQSKDYVPPTDGRSEESEIQGWMHVLVHSHEVLLKWCPIHDADMKKYHSEIAALQQRVDALTKERDEALQRVEQGKKLYEMTLANEMLWMRITQEAQASCAEMQSVLRLSLKIPQAWMGGHITFDQWDAACEKVFKAIDTPNPGAPLLALVEAGKELAKAVEYGGNPFSGSDWESRMAQALAAFRKAEKEAGR